MLLQSLRALCKAPGGAGSVWKYIKMLLRATGVSGRFAYGFRTKLHFADAYSECTVRLLIEHLLVVELIEVVWRCTHLGCVCSYTFCLIYPCLLQPRGSAPRQR